MPLLAVAALAVLLVLITFGIDSATLRQASKALDHFNQQICREAASHAPLQRLAAQSFAERLNTAIKGAQVPNINLTRARLFMPTMPRDGSFIQAAGGASFLSGAVHKFADLGINPCAINCVDGECRDCEFEGRLRPVEQDTELSEQPFKNFFGNDLSSVGRSVMCVLQGEVPTLWRGTLPLRSVSVWSNDVKAGAQSPATRSINVPLAERAALSVILAPQVQSHAADARFLFGPPSTDLEYPQEFRAAYDPLYEFESPSGNGINAFAGDPRVLTEDRKELLVSCMSPLVLARNTLLSQIAELAMRHGELRGMTQLLYLNPVLGQSDGTTPQPPVEVTSLGQDVAQRHFQIPFASSAWLDPASNTSQAYSWLLASELRFCYHMYGGYYLYNQALDRFALPGFDQSNAGFEPRGQGEVYWFSKSLRPTLFQSGQPWDQECPWRDSVSGCQQISSRDLNIAEMLAITGSEQICPYQPGATADWSCRKPAPDTDLRGDLLSALCYLIGPQAETAVCDKLGSKRVALRSPGALRESDRSPLTQQAQNTRSAVLLLTHQALSSSDRSAIHDLLEEGHFDSRPITVIYMPAFGAPGIGDAAANGQYLSKVREDFKQAFDIREDSDAHSANQKRPDNALIVLSPYMDPAYCRLQDSSQCYAAYWKHLLLDPDGAASIGREIFQERILSLEGLPN